VHKVSRFVDVPILKSALVFEIIKGQPKLNANLIQLAISHVLAYSALCATVLLPAPFQAYAVTP
jgi:hypothetical protein